MSKTMTIDDLVGGELSPKTKNKKSKESSTQQSSKQQKVKEKAYLASQKEREEKAEKENKERLGGDRLLRDANNVLEIQLKRTPQYKVLNKQIEILKAERLTYKKLGDEQNQIKCELLIKDIVDKVSGFKKLFKNRNTKEKVEKIKEKISNSEELKSLVKERKEIVKKYNLSLPSYWFNRLKDYREQIELRETLNDYSVDEIEIEDLNDEELNDLKIQINDELPVSDDTTDTSDKLSTENDNQLLTEYTELCGTITRMINEWIRENPDFMEEQEKLISEAEDEGKSTAKFLRKVSIQDIMDFPLSRIRNYLNIVLSKDKQELLSKKDELDVKISVERTKLSGGSEVTDVLYEIFDYTEEEKVPKEILAASYVPYVKSRAYNLCMKHNALKDLDDAIAYGLLALTNLINKWYNAQKFINSPLSFAGLINIEIPFAIEKGLLELKGGGAISGTNKATIYSRLKKRRNDFIKYNPEFKDFGDTEFLDKIISGTDDNVQFVTESDYTATIGSGSDELQDADIWANKNVDDSVSIEETHDSKIEYNRFLKALKKLFSLFEYRENKNGEIVAKNRKMFDKYDRRIFMMYFGFETKPLTEKDVNKKTGSVRNTYNKKEIAKEIEYMMRADGYPNKTFTVAALTDSRPGHEGRLTKILQKLTNLSKTNPDIAEAFNYVWNYYQEHKGAMDLMSSSREELVDKVDRDELREIYSEIPQKLNMTMADGTKLSDIVEISENNPLDKDSIDVFFEDDEEELL